MGTIVARPRKDGTVGYTAQIKIKREGRFVFSQAQTFDREAAAKAWIKRKEAELAKPGALDAARKPKGNLSDTIDKYLHLSRKDMGKTKAQVLATIKKHDIAALAMADIRPQDVVAWARWLGDTRKPQTVQNYLSHLSAVFSVARAAWGHDIDRNVMRDASETLKHFGVTAKSAKRERRPTVDEINRLMVHFVDRSKRRNAMPMHRVIAFAMLSTRRQEEITRITWADLEPGRVLVRDMKNPGEKAGNDVWCGLVPEAEAIARAMPNIAQQMFPFGTNAISAAFTRACHVLGIEDLHFHDLRHEGASRLFEMGWTIPRVAEVTGHRSWQSLQRYSHLRQTGDKWAGWKWLDLVVNP
jgi:integrase